MNIIEVKNLTKRFCEVFGLLVPAMPVRPQPCVILDVFRPGQGPIAWNGTPVGEVPRPQWGYLPEERSLYPKVEASAQGIAASSQIGSDPGNDLSINIANRSIDHDLQ